jgi:hypothetical protein
LFLYISELEISFAAENIRAVYGRLSAEEINLFQPVSTMSGKDQKREVVLVGEGQHCERCMAAQRSEICSVHEGPHTSLCGDVSRDWNDTGTQQLNLRGQNRLPVLFHFLAVLMF